MPGRPGYLENSGARTYCACEGADRGCLDNLFVYLVLFSS